MYRTILADKDVDNTKNISKYMNTNYQQFKIIRVLNDLRHDYISLLRKLAPQLIIADIKFFGVNASMILSDIHLKFPDVKFILYGQLNESEYLKKYLELGALSYMIKPLKPSDLAKCLENTAKHFETLEKKEQEMQKLMKSYKDNEQVFESMFLSNLLNGILTDKKEIESNFEYYGINTKSEFTVIHIKIDHFQGINSSLEPQEKHLMVYGMLNTTITSLQDYNSKSFMSSFNTVTVILANVLGLEEIYKIGDMVKNNILNKNNIKATVGIGRTYDEVTDIQKSYNEAVIALNHRYYLGYNSVIPIDFAQPKSTLNLNYMALKEQKLAFTAAVGEFENCSKLLDEVFSVLRKSEPLPERMISQIVVQIMISIGRYVSEQNHIKEVEMTAFFKVDDAIKIETVDEGYTYLYPNIKRFCEYINEERLREDHSIIERAKDYVSKRYYETISLFRMALIVKTTPDYLNKLFIEYEKEAFYEYAVKKRLDVGKKFLRDTDLDDSVIAVNIGYDDGKYFNAVFKKYENMDTSEYRTKYKNS